MKKKFVLTLALVLMVAVGLSAAPLEVSGEFNAGYIFTFVSSGNSVAAKTATEADIDSLVAFEGDFWKVTLTDGPVDFGNGMAATADIYLHKALGEQGLDMGDIELTLHIGNDVSKDVLSVFDDGDQAGFSSGLAMTAAYNTGLTFKYADLVTVYASFDPTLTTYPMVIGAKANVVDGVSVAGGFTTTGNGISGSVRVDVAALAGIEDFSLVASAEDIYMIDAETNELNAELLAGYEGISAWFGYQMDIAKDHNLAAGVGYSTVISDIGLSASVTMKDLTDLEQTDIEAGANYSMGGVKYALDTKYAIASKTFTLTPSVTIAF